jgi:FkbM family methyltransferase
VGNGASLVRGLVNTFRVAATPAEAAGLLATFGKSVAYLLAGKPGGQRDAAVRIQGAVHVVGLGSGELLTVQEQYWERAYDRLPDFVARDGWTVLDVGANAGVYAVQQALRGARVYAFEPNPDCFRRLQKAVAANRLGDRVTAVPRALGAAPGTATLHVPDGFTAMGSLRPAVGAADGGLPVQLDTLDLATRALGVGRVDLLKVDVEGFEADVLAGAGATLARTDRVVVEYHSAELGRLVTARLVESGLPVVLDAPDASHGGPGRGFVFARRPSA